MRKKIITLVLAATMTIGCVGLVGCSNDAPAPSTTENTETPSTSSTTPVDEPVVVGEDFVG